MRFYPLIALLGLAACGAPETSREAGEAEAPGPVAVRFAERREISPSMFVVVIPAGSSRTGTEAAARELCDGEAFCKVMGWTDNSLLPRGFPLTDRELAGQAFSYTLNRNSGMDEAVWACDAASPDCPK